MTTRTPRLEIEYCTQCRWLLRAAWLAQELLTTFPRDLGEVALVPGIGGVFEVRLDGEILWNRKPDGFPDLAQLKRMVRDRVAPDRDLGHSDRTASPGSAATGPGSAATGPGSAATGPGPVPAES